MDKLQSMKAMKAQKGFIPLLLVLLFAGVFVGSTLGAAKAEASFPWWNNIVQFFHHHFGHPGGRGGGTIGGSGQGSGGGTSGGGTNSPACKVASITKGSEGFKGTMVPLLSFKWDQNGSDLYNGGTCLTCHPPAGAPGSGKYKILGRWTPNQQFIIFVAESAQVNPQIPKNAQTLHEYIQNGYYGNLWAMTPDGSKWYQLTNYSQATDGKLYGVLAPIASNNKVVWAKLVKRADSSAPEAYWRLYTATLVVNGSIPSLANVHDITPPNTTLVEPQDFTPDQSQYIVSMNTNTPQYGWDSYLFNAATDSYTNTTNTPNQWDEHARISPDGKRVVWATSLPYPPPPFNVPYSQFLNQYLKMEFWLMNIDGSEKQQLTHFNQPGYPEYTGQKEIANVPIWSADGTQILAGVRPEGLSVINFQGTCGKQ